MEKKTGVVSSYPVAYSVQWGLVIRDTRKPSTTSALCQVGVASQSRVRRAGRTDKQTSAGGISHQDCLTQLLPTRRGCSYVASFAITKTTTGTGIIYWGRTPNRKEQCKSYDEGIKALGNRWSNEVRRAEKQMIIKPNTKEESQKFRSLITRIYS